MASSQEPLCRQLRAYADLVLHLAVRDLKVRYKNLWLGFLWTLLVPLVTALILNMVFTYVVRIEMSEYPFFLFLVTGLFPWTFFSLSLSTGVTSITESGNLIKKTSVRRAAIPLSYVAANLVNFLLTLVILIAVVLVWQGGLPPLFFLLPVVILIQMAFVSGLVLAASGLHAHFRDIKYIVELVLFGWFYMIPSFYPVRLIREEALRRGADPRAMLEAYLADPMAGIVVLYRGTLLRGYLDFLPAEVGYWRLLAQTALASLIVLGLGLAVYRKCEPAFADLT